MIKPVTMTGTVHWAGIYRGNAAIVLTYYGGASLWHHADGVWARVVSIGTDRSIQDIVPHRCESCGTELPEVPA